MFHHDAHIPPEGVVVDDDDIDIAFVGRESQRCEIKSWITSRKKRLFQFCGQSMVGKSRLAKQILKELLSEAQDRGFAELVTAFIPVREVKTLETIKLRLSMLFGFPDAAAVNFTSSLFAHFKRDKTTIYVVVLDNCESMSEDPVLLDAFMGLVRQLVEASPNISIILTSLRQLTFSFIKKACQELVKVPPLTDKAVTLLRNVTSNVDMNEQTRFRLCELCHFLPYTIIFVGRILDDFPEYSAEEVIEILEKKSYGGLENESHPGSDRPFTTLHQHLKFMTDKMEKASIKCAYFPATFGADAAAYLGGYDSTVEAKTSALVPLRLRNILDYSPETMRYEMHSVYRDYLNRTKVVNINEMRDTRKMFAEYFGNIVVTVNDKLGKQPQQMVLGQYVHDWPNIEHLLKEAIHGNDADTFAVYMKLVKKAEYFIQKFMPENGIVFYKAIMDQQRLFGDHNDEAMLWSHLGNAMSNTTYISSDESLKPMIKAYHMMLRAGEPSIQLKKLMGYIAWTYYLLGRTEEAEKMVVQALNISICNPDSEENQHLNMKLKSHLSIALTFLARYDESNELLYATIAEAKQKCPHHPVISVMLNTLGLNYDRCGQRKAALDFFLHSLAERRKSQPETNLIIPLKNVANSLMDLGSLDEAMVKLNESLDIQQRHNLGGLNLGHTYRHFGKCYYLMHDYPKALTYFTQTIEVYSQFSPKYYGLPGVELQCAQCENAMDKRQDAIERCRQVVDNPARYYKDKSGDRNTVMKEAFDNLMDFLYDQPDLHDRYRLLMEAWLREAAGEYRNEGNMVKSSEFMSAAFASQKLRTARMRQLLLSNGLSNLSLGAVDGSRECNSGSNNESDLDVDVDVVLRMLMGDKS